MSCVERPNPIDWDVMMRIAVWEFRVNSSSLLTARWAVTFSANQAGDQDWWYQQREHISSLPVPFTRFHPQASGKLINLPGKRKHCTILQYHFSDVLVKANFRDKLTTESRSNLCTCQELKTGQGSPIRRNRQYIGRKICSADSTAGALAVTGRIFCYRWKSSFYSFLCSSLMLSVLRNFLLLHPFRTLLITFWGYVILIYLTNIPLFNVT